MSNLRNQESREESRGHDSIMRDLLSEPSQAGVPQSDFVQHEAIGIVQDEAIGNTNNSGTIRELNIREVNRGFIVQAGCHTFAISKAEELITLLTEYITNPYETERKWFNGDLIKR